MADPQQQRHHTDKARVWSAVLAAAVAVALAGCSDAAEPDVTAADSPTSTRAATSHATARPSSDAIASPSPSPSDDAVAQKVIDAYLGYWDAIRAANDPPNENHPDLKRFATGDAYESVFDAAQTNRLAGRALRLPDDSISEHRVEVVSIDNDEAIVRDCSVNDGLVVDIDTGEVVNDEVVTRLATGRLRRADGVWKVATTKVERTWEGVAGCAD